MHRIATQQISDKTQKIPKVKASNKQALPGGETKGKNATSVEKKL